MYKKITLSTTSPFITELKSDTIFGHLCWSIAQEEGEDEDKDELKKILNQFKDNPIFTISNACLQDKKERIFVPRPFWAKMFERDKTQSQNERKDYDRHKDFKDANLVSLEELKGLLTKDDFELFENDRPRNMYKNFTQMKNVISREDFSVDEMAGGIYPLDEKWMREGEKLVIYLRILDKDEFNEFDWEKHFRNVFEVSGFGAKKSTGYGIFKIESFAETDDFKNFEVENKTGENLLLLSNAVLSKDEINLLDDGHYPGNDKVEERQRAFYQMKTKYGKLGEEGALGGNPFKKPLMQLQAGSVFLEAGAEKDCIGQLENLIEGDNDIVDFNYGFCVNF